MRAKRMHLLSELCEDFTLFGDGLAQPGGLLEQPANPLGLDEVALHEVADEVCLVDKNRSLPHVVAYTRFDLVEQTYDGGQADVSHLGGIMTRLALPEPVVLTVTIEKPVCHHRVENWPANLRREVPQPASLAKRHP